MSEMKSILKFTIMIKIYITSIFTATYWRVLPPFEIENLPFSLNSNQVDENEGVNIGLG